MDTSGGMRWGGGGGGVLNWSIGIDMDTLMCIKWMTNKNLLYKNKEEKKRMIESTIFTGFTFSQNELTFLKAQFKWLLLRLVDLGSTLETKWDNSVWCMSVPVRGHPALNSAPLGVLTSDQVCVMRLLKYHLRFKAPDQYVFFLKLEDNCKPKERSGDEL